MRRAGRRRRWLTSLVLTKAKHTTPSHSRRAGAMAKPKALMSPLIQVSRPLGVARLRTAPAARLGSSANVNVVNAQAGLATGAAPARHTGQRTLALRDRIKYLPIALARHVALRLRRNASAEFEATGYSRCVEMPPASRRRGLTRKANPTDHEAVQHHVAHGARVGDFVRHGRGGGLVS